MKASSLLAAAFLACGIAGCRPGAEPATDRQALLDELRTQRETMHRLRAETGAERLRIYRAAVGIQGRVQELERNLSLAQTEIWGDGSPTAARLATAQRSPASLQAEVNALVAGLRTGSRTD